MNNMSWSICLFWHTAMFLEFRKVSYNDKKVEPMSKVVDLLYSGCIEKIMSHYCCKIFYWEHVFSNVVVELSIHFFLCDGGIDEIIDNSIEYVREQ